MLDFKNYRLTDIENRLNRGGYCPLDIMVTGVTGAGKSTTLNSFFQKTVAKEGDGVDPETMNIDFYNLHDDIRLWDTPGLGDGVKKDQEHKKKMLDLLYKSYGKSNNYGLIDLALVIIEGGGRDMGSTSILLNEVIVPNIQKDRILVAINQADFALKGRNWNHESNEPEPKLLDFLKEKAISVKERVREATGVDILTPVFYSAKYNYNIKELYDFIINNIPSETRVFIK